MSTEKKPVAKKATTTGKAATSPAARKTAAKRTTAKTSTAKKSSARKSTAKRSTTGRTTSSTRRRATPKTSTAVGTALGTLAVAWVLGASWPARIGLALLVALLVLGYAYWRARSVAAQSDPPPVGAEAGPATGTLPAPLAAPDPQTEPEASHTETADAPPTEGKDAR